MTTTEWDLTEWIDSPVEHAVTNRMTVTGLIPAHNEESGISDTIDSMLRQTVPFDEIIVVADNCSDQTVSIAKAMGVTVLETPEGVGGSKAKAQNYGLEFVTTDLVLPVDADTLLAPDYLEIIVPVMHDPDVAIAAGCVQSRHARSAVEKGRTVEYLFGFHWIRPIQAACNAPIVCSGCCSVFRTIKIIEDFGGFPMDTIVEDFDATHRWQIAGYKAKYVPKAEAYAADPENIKFLNIQMERWLAGFYQNVRKHLLQEIKHKPMLALWMILALVEIVLIPFWYLAPVLGVTMLGWPIMSVVFWYVVFETFVTGLPVAFGVFKRKLGWKTLLYVPFVWVNRLVNQYQALKQFGIELIGVPLGLTSGLSNYKMGR